MRVLTGTVLTRLDADATGHSTPTVDQRDVATASDGAMIGGRSKNLLRPVFSDGTSVLVYFHRGAIEQADFSGQDRFQATLGQPSGPTCATDCTQWLESAVSISRQHGSYSSAMPTRTRAAIPR